MRGRPLPRPAFFVTPPAAKRGGEEGLSGFAASGPLRITDPRRPAPAQQTIPMTHPNKHVREAIKYALGRGWRLTHSKGHPWGTLWCPERSRAGHFFHVASTPVNRETHAKRIRAAVDLCPHSTGAPG